MVIFRVPPEQCVGNLPMTKALQWRVCVCKSGDSTAQQHHLVRLPSDRCTTSAWHCKISMNTWSGAWTFFATFLVG